MYESTKRVHDKSLFSQQFFLLTLVALFATSGWRSSPLLGPGEALRLPFRFFLGPQGVHVPSEILLEEVMHSGRRR